MANINRLELNKIYTAKIVNIKHQLDEDGYYNFLTLKLEIDGFKYKKTFCLFTNSPKSQIIEKNLAIIKEVFGVDIKEIDTILGKEVQVIVRINPSSKKPCIEFLLNEESN